MNNTKISIIVPVYNVEPYIRECFSSIAAQTYNGEMECIFVDDCGQDNSVSVLKGLISEYDGPIKISLIHHGHNKGLSGARNTGIRHATGDYLFFLDSDDTITPDCIAKLVALAVKHPGVDMVQGSTNGTANWLRLKHNLLPSYSHSFRWIRQAMLKRCTIPMTSWNKLVRRDMVLEYGLYFEEGYIHEDEIWMFMLAKYVHSIAFCFDITYNYRDNPDGIIGKTHKFNYGPVLDIMVSRASQPYLFSEIKCFLDLAGNEHNDILQRLCRFKGVKEYLNLLKKVRATTKYTPMGFFYRIIIRCIGIYINMVNHD